MEYSELHLELLIIMQVILLMGLYYIQNELEIIIIIFGASWMVGFILFQEMIIRSFDYYYKTYFNTIKKSMK
jgi:hypothetical protein